jgi:hypothetical protein
MELDLGLHVFFFNCFIFYKHVYGHVCTKEIFFSHYNGCINDVYEV